MTGSRADTVGMDLIGRRRSFYWNNHTWSALLQLGIRYGWKPHGTGPPPGTSRGSWTGGYDSNDGQYFYARDADKLAEALQAFLNRATRDEAEEWFSSAEGKRATRRFVGFLRKGGFRIH